MGRQRDTDIQTGFMHLLTRLSASLAAQTLKNPPAMRETRVRSLGREDPLEEEMAPHSSILAGESLGQRSLAGYSPRGRRESDMTERPHFTSLHSSAGLVGTTSVLSISLSSELSTVQFSSVAQSCPTLCDPHESQHARPPCLSPTPGVHSNSCPSSW